MVGADARAGRDDRPFAGRPKGRSKEHFLLSSEPPLEAPSAHAAEAAAARHELELLLAGQGHTLATSLPPSFLDAIERYVALLLDANARLNLTRVVGPADVARLHLLDALSALPVLDERPVDRAVDLGSGGGVPGIVLALARPTLRWALVDSVRKKAETLTRMRDGLGLRDLVVLPERAEDLGRSSSWRETVDVVTARACAPLPVLVEYALPLIRPGGRLLAWKGPIGDDELRDGTVAATAVGGSEPQVRTTGIPALGEHRLVVVDKVEHTRARFPRRAGEPTRRPLGRG
jgi:16S rRNA (guanine527-N7)-methyltransferase